MWRVPANSKWMFVSTLFGPLLSEPKLTKLTKLTKLKPKAQIKWMENGRFWTSVFCKLDHLGIIFEFLGQKESVLDVFHIQTNKITRRGKQCLFPTRSSLFSSSRFGRHWRSVSAACSTMLPTSFSCDVGFPLLIQFQHSFWVKSAWIQIAS